MKTIECQDCSTSVSVYKIITNVAIDFLCSRCIDRRETVDIIKESGRVPLKGKRGIISLNVKELKERLKDVPDDTPVAFQRMEDSLFNQTPHTGWTTHELRWDDRDTSEYVEASTAYWHYDTDVFVINAHY